jgi:hypothetical protein
MPQLSSGQLLVMIVTMIVLELNHLKWIWWTQWECRCGVKHEHCACGERKWIMYL